MWRFILLYTLLILSSLELIAQGVCSGNLGENIFTKGDFGSGSDPVLQSDPMIAPGYNYTTVVPSDGSYTICSSTSALNGLFPTWISTSDNSGDPDGYMMVINASYEPGIFYEETVDGLCENTLYEFSADIINLVKIGVANHIDPNVTFLIDGVEEYTTGTIAKTGSWAKYGFSFVTNSSQSSITLTIRNNAPGGSGNDLALDNISFRPCGPSSFIGLEDEENTIFLCIDDEPLTVVADIEGDDNQTYALQWQSSLDGINWIDLAPDNENFIIHDNFIPGDYYYRYFSAGNEINLQNPKCRIISDEILITILPDTYQVADTSCVGQVYDFGEQQVFTTGMYVENFESQHGCDSIVYLDLYFESPKPINYDVNLKDPSCYNFSDGMIDINAISGGNGDLEYFLSDSTGMMVDVSLGAGDYFMEVVDKYGCKDSHVFILHNPDELSIDIGKDTIIKLGAELDFDPYYSTLFETVSWTGMGEFDCVDCENVSFLPFQTGQVILHGADQSGCEAVDSITINVIETNLVYFPNIFSPNDDKINDFFTINFFGRSVSRIRKISVFDRWGGLVVNETDLVVRPGDSIWDGYDEKGRVSSGVYSYFVSIEYINGKQEDVFGSVTVTD